MARITVKTLAETLGVSAATVSNAYNRPDQLSADLRQRILRTAAELGYAGPDAAARSLRSGRAHAVGVLLTERVSYAFSDPYAMGFLAGLTETVERHRGTSVVLLPLAEDEGVPDVAAVQRANIDAMALICLGHDHPAARVARARNIRVVGTDIDPDPDASWVAVDDVAVGTLLGRHLAGLGHRRVAVIADTAQAAGTVQLGLAAADIGCIDCAARIRGLQSVLTGAVEIVSGGHNAVESGAAAAAELLDRDAPPTAIVGLSDVVASGVLRTATERGIRVPEDLSVCGVDDVPAAAGWELTTVRQPIQEKGRRVGELLLEPATAGRQILLPIELVVRGSTAAPRPERLSQR